MGAGGEGDRLTVIAARGGDDAAGAGMAPPEVVHVGEAAAHLEGADGRVVLVLDPDLGAGARGQQRPGNLRRRRHGGVDGLGRRLYLGQARQMDRHCASSLDRQAYSGRRRRHKAGQVERGRR